jgi:putative MATE family efflux protein
MPTGRDFQQTDWTKGNVFRNLLSLSWPMIINRGLTTLRPIVDTIVVGRLGPASLAGVGVGAMIVMFMQSMMWGLVVGLRAMVARLVGAGDKEAANHAAQQGYVISIILAIILAAIGSSFARDMLLLLGVETDVAALAVPYIQILFVTAVLMLVRYTNEAIMEAAGDTITPMKISAMATVLHVTFCPFLVYGWWFFPRLEITGAAWAGVIAQGAAASLGLWILLTGRSRLRLVFRAFKLDLNMIWRMLKIGIPASMTTTQRSFARLIMMRFVAAFGTPALAAHTLLTRIIDNFTYTPIMAWGMGAGVLAGQNLGAGQPDRAQRTAWLAVALSSALALLVSITIWFWAEGITRIFTPEAEVIGITATFLRIEIVSLLVVSLAIVLSQCLNGVGDTLPVMLVNLVTMWGVAVPLAYFLPQVANLGVYGIRWAMVTSVVSRAVFYAIYFLRGRWKRKKV